MTNRLHVRLVWLVLSSAVLIGTARAAPPREPSDDMLAGIPHDTSYLIAHTRPLPPAVLARLRAALTPALDLFESEIRRTEEQVGDTTDGRWAKAIIAELKGRLDWNGIRQMGFDPGLRFVVHGVGLLPVVRLRLNSPKALEAMAQRIETRAGQPIPSAVYAGQRYWRFKLGSMVLAAAIIGRELRLTLGPKQTMTTVLSVMLNGDVEGSPVSARLRQAATPHGLPPSAAGFVDLEAIAQAISGTGSAHDNQTIEHLRPLLREMHEEIFEHSGGLVWGLLLAILTHPPSASCTTEYARLSRLWPKVVFGAPMLTGEEVTLRWVIETEPDLARALSAVRTVPIEPAIRPQGEQVMVAMNADAVLDLLEKAVGIQRARPFECDALVAINRWAVELGSMLDGAARWFSGTDGLFAQFEHAGRPWSSQLEQAVISLRGSDQRQSLSRLGFLLSLGGQGFPQDAFTDDLGPEPRRIREASAHTPGLFVATPPDTVSVALGAWGPEVLQRLQSAKPNDLGPAIRSRTKPAATDTAVTSPMQADAISPMQAALSRGFVSIIERIDFTLDLTAAGVVIENQLQMRAH